MTAVGDRTSEGFFLTVPEKLDDPYADFRYLREQHPDFFYEPLSQWFVFSFDDVDALFHDERLSADRMKGFVDAAPEECRPELRRLAPFFESWVLMTDGPAHARLRSFLHAGFNPAAVRRLRGAIQDSADLLLDAAAGTGRIDVCGDYAFLLRPTSCPTSSASRPSTGPGWSSGRWTSSTSSTSSRSPSTRPGA
jgi:cytochrome P450